MSAKKLEVVARAAACGCGANEKSRKALAVDPEIKTSNLKRLRRIEGQVRGLQRLVEEERHPGADLFRAGSPAFRGARADEESPAPLRRGSDPRHGAGPR